MQDLVKKIEELRDLIKGLGVASKKPSMVPALSLPTIKPLSMPSVSAPSASAKLPGVEPMSNKDPKKMVEQLKNPRPKKPKIEIMKADDEQHYRIHVEGHPVTEPMSLKHLTSVHGPVQRIESDPNHKVVPYKAPSMPKPKSNGQW